MRIRRSAFLAFLFACMPLFAQERTDRKTGITFSIGQPDSAVAVRRLVTPNWMVLGSLLYSRGNTAVGVVAGTSSDVTSWGLGAGVRRIFVSEELRPFLEIAAAERRADLPGCGHINYPYATAGGGVEYFFARRVSVEGTAGLNYSRFSENCSDAGGNGFRIDSHSFSTFRSALSLTFYF